MPREVAHRIHEALTLLRWRRRHGRIAPPVSEGDIHEIAIVHARLAEASSLASVADSVARTRAGRLSFFGRPWPAVAWDEGAGAAFWCRDVVTGRLWPGAEAGFLAVDLRRTGHDPAGPRPGDVKFVWEPARLQVLHPLAAAAAAGDDEAGRLGLAILRDFAAANPPHRGVHWCSGIELGLRLVAVTLLTSALGPGGLDAPDRALIRGFVAAHARQIAAFPSLHSSANNHRVAEGLGLFLAGCLLPDDAAGWRREGRTILEAEALRQILPDGAGAEQAPGYQAFTCEMIAFAALVADGLGDPFAPATIDRLAAAAGFLRALLDADGHAPAIGDDDESRVVAQPPDREPRYVASVVAAIAGLTGRPDLLPAIRDPHLRDVLFAVPEVAVPEVVVPGGVAEPRRGVSVFRDGGYTVADETVAGRRVHLVFDHGPLGYLSLAAHGHADALALWLSVDGTPVVIDPGTFLYNAGGPMRLRLRESPSHSTLAVAGASQSRASSAFGWSNRAVARLETDATGPGAWSVTGRHDGYRGRFGVDHRRTVARDGDGFAILDTLVRVGPHACRDALPVEIRFLLPGDLGLVVADGAVAVARGKDTLCRMIPPEGFSVAIHRGAARGAVRSRGFGDLEDAQRIVFGGTMAAAPAVTRIAVVGPERADRLARDLLSTTPFEDEPVSESR